MKLDVGSPEVIRRAVVAHLVQEYSDGSQDEDGDQPSQVNVVWRNVSVEEGLSTLGQPVQSEHPSAAVENRNQVNVSRTLETAVAYLLDV